MLKGARLLALAAIGLGVTLVYVAATAQQGEPQAQPTAPLPGSPGATTSIDGKQLPPPPPKFGGVIKESAKETKPWWPPRVDPPRASPTCFSS